MKPFLTAVLLSLAAMNAVPAMAQSVNVGGMMPTLTYPEPAPEPVTQGDAGINK